MEDVWSCNGRAYLSTYHSDLSDRRDRGWRTQLAWSLYNSQILRALGRLQPWENQTWYHVGYCKIPSIHLVSNLVSNLVTLGNWRRTRLAMPNTILRAGLIVIKAWFRGYWGSPGLGGLRIAGLMGCEDRRPYLCPDWTLLGVEGKLGDQRFLLM